VKKVYVAGRWEDRERVREVQEALEDIGYTIMLDWTNHEYPQDELLCKWAEADIMAASAADLVVVIMEEPHDYKGAWAEIGAALGNGKPVYIAGHGCDSAIMLHHPLVKQFEHPYHIIDELIKRL
jgi:nucleoside 2-deoxyribosyltransferase